MGARSFEAWVTVILLWFLHLHVALGECRFFVMIAECIRLFLFREGLLFLGENG